MVIQMHKRCLKHDDGYGGFPCTCSTKKPGAYKEYKAPVNEEILGERSGAMKVINALKNETKISRRLWPAWGADWVEKNLDKILNGEL